MQEKYPLHKTKRPPRECTNEATKLFIKYLNIAARNLEGWDERAYKDAAEIKRYLGVEGDELDFADPDEWLNDDEDYSLDFQGFEEKDYD